MDHAIRIMPPERKSWALAMQGEMSFTQSDADAFIWACGCVMACYQQRIIPMRNLSLSSFARATFTASALCICFAITFFVVLVAWNAAHSDGLIVDSFSVPRVLAEKGDTGEVVAGRLLDKINLAQTLSQPQTRPGRSFVLGGDDTGFFRFMHAWLGHETHIGGAVIQEGAGLVVILRMAGSSSASYAGPEGELDALLQKAAEHVVDVTQTAKRAAR